MERDAVRVLESRSVGYAEIPQNIYSGFSLCDHHSPAVVLKDWLYSEALAASWEAEGEV